VAPVLCNFPMLQIRNLMDWRWRRLSCRAFRHNAVRLQLYALAYNIANFLRTLALLKEIEH
jgi:hypothetical protein